MAAIHAAAFPVGARWSKDAIALQLGLVGAFGLIDGAGAFVLARVAADEAEILTLATLPEARRQGLARGLLQAALDKSGARGARAMLLEVGEENLAARALYRGARFIEVGRRADYYGPGRAALILRGEIPFRAG